MPELLNAGNGLPARTRGGFQKPPLRAAARVVPIEGSATQGQAGDAPKLLKRLVWLYFWLLLIEGAMRKWWLPGLSAPLLIIRDPVVLTIYFLAHQHRLVPRENLYRFLMLQAVAGIFVVGAQYLILRVPPFVLLYGYRTLFLHFPLIFLFPLIFNREDVLRMGRWFLVLSVPMAVLMAVQFNSPADAWINRTVGNSGTFQISSAMGKIRPPGTFSFVSGSVGFFGLVTAFLGYGLVAKRRTYDNWILVGAAIAVGLAVAVSGSRATILSGGIVVLAWMFGAVAGQRISSAVTNSLMIVIIAIFVLGQIDLFQQGKEILNERFEMGHEVEAREGGLAGRFFGELIRPLQMISDLPFFGAGLGVGTNVGAALLTGKMQFLMSEGEWGRVLLEMGPLFGLLFIGFRIALTVRLGRDSLEAARRSDLLPIVLFSACAVSLFSGQISQPTTLGFTVLGAGLCWASLRGRVDSSVPSDAKSAVQLPPTRLPFRRST
jgi:hypothetical protein